MEINGYLDFLAKFYFLFYFNRSHEICPVQSGLLCYLPVTFLSKKVVAILRVHFHQIGRIFVR